MAAADEKETYAFSADISQLMSLIINSFYSNKEIFIRELISNASDAMDKIQFQAAENPEGLAVNPDMYVRISTDRDARTITVEDAGIGMTRTQMIDCLGTIAKSGTKAFMEAATVAAEDGDLTMIGQFGVGFYSAYLVSARLQVISKHNDDDQHIWESTAGGTFSVLKDETFEHGVLKRGTKIICFLKDDQDEFLESQKLKDLILKHSAFVEYPISLHFEHRKEEAVEGSEEKVVTSTFNWELINKNKPVWLRMACDVPHEDYAELYKWLAGDWQDHLGVKHVWHSSQVEYKTLLYCPQSPPKDMFDMGKMSDRFSIRLYVRRVFIKEFNDLIPKWMGFIKGIIDSDDMPLNISREKLQANAILKHIKTGLVKYIFEMFLDLSRDKAKYKIFIDSFSQCLKLGVYEDNANRAQIIPLLRYRSTKSGEGLVSLDEYLARMKAGQRHILYITGRTYRDAGRSPYIEGLKRDGYEVLFMVDPVDEYALQFMKEYGGFSFMSCMNQDAGRLLEKARSDEDVKKDYEPMRRALEIALEGNVGGVFFVADLSSDVVGRIVPGGADATVLELNLKHNLLKELAKRGGQQDEVLMGVARILLDASQLEGATPEDPRRSEVAALCSETIIGLTVGERDDCPDEIPVLQESAPQPFDLGGTPKKDAAALSCGSIVRVVKKDRARRATVSFVSDAGDKIDVMYPKQGGGEEEEEGVAVSSTQALFDFEALPASATDDELAAPGGLFKAATLWKDQGNQLYKLKDFEAASERYSAIIALFGARKCMPGTALLAVRGTGQTRYLQSSTVRSVDRETGELELAAGFEAQPSSVLPAFVELLPLQTAAYMNRARCRQGLCMNTEAAQDLTIVIGLWGTADKRMLEAEPEMKEAQVKASYTARYLRARCRLNRGMVKQASADVRDALAKNPPAATAKQLRELKAEVQAAQEEYKRVTAPIQKELARLKISLGAGPDLS